MDNSILNSRNGLSKLCVFCFIMLHCASTLLCIARDGLIYPIWFSWFLLLSVLIINTYNLINLDYFTEPASELEYQSYLTLHPISQNPLYQKAQHYAYSQISLVLIYLLYSLCKDKQHKYFGLIFDRRRRKM